MIQVKNNTSTVLTANSVIPFTTIAINTNSRLSFDSSSNAIKINKKGVYAASGTFVYTPSVAGTMTITMYVNGVAQATSSFSVATGDTYTFSLPKQYINTISAPYGSNVPITFVTDTEGTLVSASAYAYYNETTNE